MTTIARWLLVKGPSHPGTTKFNLEHRPEGANGNRNRDGEQCARKAGHPGALDFQREERRRNRSGRREPALVQPEPWHCE